MSHQPAMLMKTPRALENTRMMNDIEANTSLAFLYNNSQVAVNYAAAFKTTCSGNFCDRQKNSDWNGIKGCGCYGMSPNSTSLAIQHAITITANDETFQMDDFSSQRFSNIYLNNTIPGSAKLHMLQLTDAYVLLLDAITECVDYVNSNGGFTVVGWYKRGLINEKSLLTARVGTTGLGLGYVLFYNVHHCHCYLFSLCLIFLPLVNTISALMKRLKLMRVKLATTLFMLFQQTENY